MNTPPEQHKRKKINTCGVTLQSYTTQGLGSYYVAFGDCDQYNGKENTGKIMDGKIKHSLPNGIKRFTLAIIKYIIRRLFRISNFYLELRIII